MGKRRVRIPPVTQGTGTPWPGRVASCHSRGLKRLGKATAFIATDMTKSKLEQAVEAGQQDAATIRAEQAAKEAAERANAKAKSEALFQKYKKAMGDGTALFEIVRRVTKEDEMRPRPYDRSRGPRIEYTLCRADYQALTGEEYGGCVPEMAMAINTFAGIEARYASGSDYINSDEVKESWSDITLFWSRPKW